MLGLGLRIPGALRSGGAGAEQSSLLDGLAWGYKLDETSGVRADVLGINDLSDNNTVTSRAGKQGNAAAFNVTNSEFLNANDAAAFRLTGDKSGFVWVYFDSISTPGLISKHDSTTVREWSLFAQNDGGGHQFKFRLFDAGGNDICTAVASTFGALSTGTWYFVYWYYDSENDEVGISVNNGAIDTANVTGTIAATGAHFVIGALRNGDANHHNGAIDEAYGYDRILSSAEVTEAYNGGDGVTHPFGAAPPGEQTEDVTWSGDDFAIVFLPDTQFYSRDNPAIFDSQTQWIANNQEVENIQLVLHAGDLVQSGDSNEQEWIEADEAMDILDIANIPYLAAIGNHDYTSIPNGDSRPSVYFDNYFSESRYTAKSWWNGGFYSGGGESGSENSYLLITISNRNYIILNLELFPRQEIVEWADGLLTTYASRDAIVLTHAYMYSDDTRLGDGDNWGPGNQNLTDAHDGDELWTALISQHQNIVMVLSGHVLNDGVGRRVDTASGSTKHQILYNNQEPIVSDQDTEGGYLRIMTVSPANGTISVETYSPWLDDSKTDSDHEFELTYQTVAV